MQAVSARPYVSIIVLVAATSSSECAIRVWDVASGEQMTAINSPSITDAWTIALTIDGQRLATGTARVLISFC